MTDQLSFPGLAQTAPRVVFFDLETLRSAGEVGGWDAIDRMGMACGVTYDTLEGKYDTFKEEDAPALVNQLRRADLVIGFNQIRFDYRVLSAYTAVDLSRIPSFDILVDITRILGHRLKLDSLATATLGEGKTADGMQSLRWVREGRIDLVCEYCRKDVEVTKKLFEYGSREGRVFFEKAGANVAIPVDWNVERLVTQARSRR